MIRNLKVLGLALVAMFAMSAVAASAASAQTGVLTSETKEDVTLTAEDTGENALTVGGSAVSCPESKYTGHKTLTTAETATKSHEFLPNGATSVTVTPHYNQVVEETANCDGPEGTSATVTMNGCDYDFYDFTTIEGEHEYSFLTDLVCPEGKHVEVHVYAGHGHGFQVCKDTITPETGLTGGRAINQTNARGVEHHVKLTGTIHGFKVHQSGLCGNKEELDGEYDLNVTVWGHNEDEEDIGVTISDEAA